MSGPATKENYRDGCPICRDTGLNVCDPAPATQPAASGADAGAVEEALAFADLKGIEFPLRAIKHVRTLAAEVRRLQAPPVGQDAPVAAEGTEVTPDFALAYADKIPDGPVSLADACVGALAAEVRRLRAVQPAASAGDEFVLDKLELARDLLMERVYGHNARSPAHNARMVLDELIAKLEARAGQQAPQATSTLRIGDRIKDNDPRMHGRVLAIQSLDDTFAYVHERLRSYNHRVRRDRIYTDDKPRKSGFSLLPRTGAAK